MAGLGTVPERVRAATNAAQSPALTSSQGSTTRLLQPCHEASADLLQPRPGLRRQDSSLRHDASTMDHPSARAEPAVPAPPAARWGPAAIRRAITERSVAQAPACPGEGHRPGRSNRAATAAASRVSPIQ